MSEKPRNARALTQQKQTPQRDRFIETARALGADEDEAAFKEKLAVIARQKVAKSAPEPKGG